MNQVGKLPSVERLLQAAEIRALVARHGRARVTDGVRHALSAARRVMLDGGSVDAAPATLAGPVDAFCLERRRTGPHPVFNLTGTVLHTNLGRAPLAREAVDAMARAARDACSLEYDLVRGRRGSRTAAVAERLRRLTGAEDALVVNNNAAAVLLLLNSLALRREVPVSRGELVEIGGSFRMPDIMARAGCRLVEVGTTNRTHVDDFANAVTARTALLLKVHASNFAIRGFTAEVPEAELARLADDRGLPLAIDLGSGALVDFGRWGLPSEPLVADALGRGADLVTFSGDKLLGGPQAGIVVGRADLLARLAANPMARALRADKMTIAALEATLALYEDLDTLPQRLPALRLLTRPAEEIAGQARRLAPALAAALGDGFSVEVTALQSQIGSGAQPVAALESAGLAVAPRPPGRGADARLRGLAAALRRLERPTVAALRDGRLCLDLRCLDDEDLFVRQLAALAAP